MNSKLNINPDSSFSLTLQTGTFSPQKKSPTNHSIILKNLTMPTYNSFDSSSSSLSPIRRGGKKSLNEVRFKQQIIFVNCSKHAEELLKFIDCNSSQFSPQCDCCIVDPKNHIGKMKLERIVDLQDRVRMNLMTNMHELKELDARLEGVTREINVANALRNPIMDVVNHMESKINKEIEYVFKRLRERFTILNPLVGVQKDVREKIEIEVHKIRGLDSQGPEALNLLRELLRDEAKMKDEMILFKSNINKKLEEAKKYNPVMDKDFGFVQNAYEEYAETTKRICEKFMLSFKRQ